VSETWVVNASPVIALARIGQLHLLERLAQSLLLPDAVAAEIQSGPADDAARAAVLSGWGSRQSPPSIPETVTEWGLGAGESAVLALAMERRPATAVLDDTAARSAARALGIPLIGTLGVVIRAKRRGLILSAGSVLVDLRKAGLYLNESTIHAALKRIDETWNP
jgi:predicted nucleic acid-binding protein